MPAEKSRHEISQRLRRAKAVLGNHLIDVITVRGAAKGDAADVALEQRQQWGERDQSGDRDTEEKVAQCLFAHKDHQAGSQCHRAKEEACYPDKRIRNKEGRGDQNSANDRQDYSNGKKRAKPRARFEPDSLPQQRREEQRADEQARDAAAVRVGQQAHHCAAAHTADHRVRPAPRAVGSQRGPGGERIERPRGQVAIVARVDEGEHIALPRVDDRAENRRWARDFQLTQKRCHRQQRQRGKDRHVAREEGPLRHQRRTEAQRI